MVARMNAGPSLPRGAAADAAAAVAISIQLKREAFALSQTLRYHTGALRPCTVTTSLFLLFLLFYLGLFILRLG